jgi:hypothetical protein
MSRAQPQYWIQATKRCTTHPAGTWILYTGPRSGIAKGWRVVSGAIRQVYGSGTTV